MHEFQLDELITYGHCPMKWRYRYEYKLPYLEVDSQEAYFLSLRKALIRYSNAFMSMGKKQLAHVTEMTLRETLAGYEYRGVFNLGEYSAMFTQGWMAILDFDRLVTQRQGFTPTSGTDVPCSTEFNGALIHGCLDIILEPPKGYSNDSVAVCHITNQRSSLYYSRFMPLKYGWTIAVLRQHLNPKIKIFHSTFSPWNSSRLNLSKNLYTRTSFTGAMRGLIKGVEARAVWQAPDTNRCTNCCYNLICDAGHSRDLKSNEIKILRERIEQWTSRRAASATKKLNIPVE